MEVRSLVPVEEYLHNTYEPDCDYVDGELVERNVGEKDHSKIQIRLAALLFNQREKLGIEAFTEQRIQVGPSRFRVPDLCVVVGEEPDEQVFTSPPFLCIEILSPEDRAGRMQQRISDYLNFGVRYVWVIDPRSRKAFIYGPSGISEVTDTLETEGPAIRIRLQDVLQ
jgi:Uma2 family endonuclease